MLRLSLALRLRGHLAPALSDHQVLVVTRLLELGAVQVARDHAASARAEVVRTADVLAAVRFHPLRLRAFELGRSARLDLTGFDFKRLVEELVELVLRELQRQLRRPLYTRSGVVGRLSTIASILQLDLHPPPIPPIPPIPRTREG